MERRKLLIADNSEEFCQALAEALQDRFQIRCCHDGKRAETLLLTETFDVLVLNLMLPEQDGLTLLERLLPKGTCPKVLALTSLQTDYILQSVENLGIAYLMMKPCEIRAIARRVRDLDQPIHPALHTRDMYAYLSQLLASFPMKTRLLGYKLLRVCILLKVNHPNMAATKELYPEAAKSCGCKGCSVERNIRTALDNSWNSPNHQLWHQYFPNATERPESTEFISRLSDDLRQKQAQGLLDPYEP